MDESHFRTLKELARDGRLSQRELAQRVGLSLGRVNFIVNSLIEKGYIKARRFKNSRNKMAYAYILTPRGIAGKAEIMRKFIVRKIEEHDRLSREIEELTREMDLMAPESEGVLVEESKE
jgi:EPS-associated MarR family transcriptional regulator